MKEEYLRKCLTEVEKEIKRTPEKTPAHRKLFKRGYSFSKMSAAEQLVIWDFIWKNASDFWVRGHAFLYLESKMKDKEFLLDSWRTIKYWQNTLEVIPDKVLPQLEKWNKSKNLWDRRQSVVSLLYFSRTKKVVLPFQKIIKFIDRLLDDKEYYVQKGVGWALKELYRVYPKETLKYLEDNIKNVSSIAFSPATEKLEKKDKEKLKKIRR